MIWWTFRYPTNWFTPSTPIRRVRTYRVSQKSRLADSDLNKVNKTIRQEDVAKGEAVKGQ